MRAGRLRHKVVIESPSGSRDAVGERTTVYTHVATDYASITPLNAQERLAGAQAHMIVTHEVIVRYHSGLASIDNGWRITHGARYLFVESVYNVEERNRSLRLLCSEGALDDGP